MRWLRFAAVVLIVVLLRLSNIDDLIAVTRFGIKPDPFLILLVFFAVQCSGHDAIIISFVLGFAADLVGGAMGVHMISFGLLGSLLWQINQVIVVRKSMHFAAAIFVTGFCSEFIIHFLTALKLADRPANTYLLVFGTSVYSAAIGPYICSALKLASKWMGLRRYRLRISIDR
ncbi:MAG: rod shape-determining protein MreD [Planctomycetota bacterium]